MGIEHTVKITRSNALIRIKEIHFAAKEKNIEKLRN